MLTSFHSLSAKMSAKVRLFFSHLEKPSENPVDVSEEQHEIFHQNIKIMVERYKGRWDVQMMADYCLSLMRESRQIYGRKSRNRTCFEII